MMSYYESDVQGEFISRYNPSYRSMEKQIGSPLLDAAFTDRHPNKFSLLRQSGRAG